MNVIRFSTESASGEAATVKSRKGKKNQDAHRRIVFLTYSQCTISSKDEFEARFSDMLQHIGYPDATYYGCREHHKTEGIHYHVLVNLRKQPNWSMKHARRAFQ
ncbi:hypothetical protein N7475_009823 [Penicillium sp. IBT 31633x]|nr:hypothetical protein N7475_009823 [Penicillium sp. IBT 31633x]